MVKRVLIGVDGSRLSREAALHAFRLVEPHGARLRLVSVVPPVPVVQDFYGVGAVDLGRLEEAGRSQLLPVEEELRGLGAQVESEVRFGAPAEVLARAAEEWDAQLVVVGSRGQGLVRRVMLGSVSDRLVHICTRPVLVFHDERREEPAG